MKNEHHHNITGHGSRGGRMPRPWSPVFGPGYYGGVVVTADDYLMQPVVAQQSSASVYVLSANFQFNDTTGRTHILTKGTNIKGLPVQDGVQVTVPLPAQGALYNPSITIVIPYSYLTAKTGFNDTGTTAATPDPYAKVVAAPNISLTVSRNSLPQPVVLTIGIVTGIALLLLAYKFYPKVFSYFKPKTA